LAAERAGFGGGAAASSTASPKNAFALATVCNFEELYGGKTLVGCLERTALKDFKLCTRESPVRASLLEVDQQG
jgi:hypothetical protein